MKYAELKQFHISEAEWPPSGAENALAGVEASRSKIVQLLARIVPELCAIPAGGSLPDLLGQTRAWLADELVSMMERKQENGFPELFLGYFNASLAVQRHFVGLAQQQGRQDNIRFAMGALLAVMDVSGIALLFSELDGTRFGQIVACAWDAYFGQAADKPAVIRALYGAIDSKLTLPWLSPSAMQRHEWGRRLARAMAERGIDADRYSGPHWSRTSNQPHSSAVIESVLVMQGHPMNDPHEYFGALYVAVRPEGQGIAVPRAVENCIASISLAKNRLTEFKNEAEDKPGDG